MSGCECKPDAKRKRGRAQPQEKRAGSKEGGAVKDMRSLRNLTLVSLCAVVLARAQAPVSGKIVQIDLADIVHPVSAAYVKDGLNHAKDIGARAVVLRLDTPGGLVDSMREMVEAILY